MYKSIIAYSLMVFAVMEFTPLQAETIAITGATIIDGNGGSPLKNGTLVIDGNRIIAVGKTRDIDVPAGARIIKAEGKYIIPGLMDTNVHLFIEMAVETLAKYEGQYDKLIIEAAQVALKAGVTTVFDSYGPRQPLVDARDAINLGEEIGSRIYLAGNIVGYDGPFSGDFWPDAKATTSPSFVKKINDMWVQDVGRRLVWMAPEQLGGALEPYLKKDIDFVKYGASGHSIGEMHFLTFSEKAQDVIVKTVKGAGLTVQTHTTSVESLRIAVEAGVDLLQHCDVTGPVVVPDSTIKMMAERQIPCAPLTMTVLGEEARIKFLKVFGASQPEANQEFIDSIQISRQNVRKMLDAGVPLLLSTDSYLNSKRVEEWFGISDAVESLTVLGEGHFHWLKAMEERGMDAMTMLMSATRDIARAYKIDKDLGTLEKGMIADLLILDENPLKSSGNYKKIHMIMKDGRKVDRDTLPTRRFLTQAN
ncbi:amidohydrolase family protein [Paremcibacter congregatus]|uniref:Amidohydrolase-related domain-containing protein n=1 Tax=Paremcibacter congregatus TaxID=2043170 RepID=A0A2G4YWN3_9PROT|nr:amidohydrolase family protein [Paremcibacter congregatus]PHZ86741.1 hypothetical protein CRD36_00125 [Paremcibacter congregatus]QDE26259.1 amidohydrolase family protein [Paremcibacter congregatus]